MKRLHILLLFICLIISSNLFAQHSIIKYDLGDYIDILTVDFTHSDNLILITDSRNELALLIDTENKNITNIDPRESFPGFNFWPIQAQIYKDRILFTNSGPWGFTISLKNDDFKELDRFFLAPHNIVSLPDKDYFFGFHPQGGGYFPKPVLVKYDYNGIAIDTTHYFDFRLPNILTRIGPFNLLYQDDSMLFSNPIDNELLVFDNSGKYVKTIPLVFDKWNAILSDVKNADNFKSIHKKFQSANGTTLSKVLKLNGDNDILVHYLNSFDKLSKYCVLKGENYTLHGCFDGDSEKIIIGAKDDFLYYLEYEEDKTYLVGMHLSEFLNQ